MKVGAVYRADDGRRILDRVWLANTMFHRLRGLLGRPPLQDGEGLLLDPCKGVHTFGMGYPLDVVFMDAAGVVIKTAQGLEPGRNAWAGGARMALELRGGSAGPLGITESIKLEWRECDTA